MTGKILSLSRARKDRAKVAKRVEADANAARYGRTNGDRTREAAEAGKARRDLDAHEIASGRDRDPDRDPETK